jgi:hypothetical protein
VGREAAGGGRGDGEGEGGAIGDAAGEHDADPQLGAIEHDTAAIGATARA